MQVQPYLFFEGHCEDAIAFYRSAIGAEVQMLMRYKDAPDGAAAPPDNPPEKIMHASLKIGDSTVLMSDGRCSGNPALGGFALSLTVADKAEAQRLFSALADGGQPFMPLTETFFSPQFGMVTDRFGLMWMVMVES
nr:VOC family protein [uncultured Rhodopila sp.]